MISLLKMLTDIAGAAFTAEGLPAEDGQVRISDRPDLAQFQCNGAMIAAKVAKKNPRAVAEAVVVRLKDNPVFTKVEIAGPGFINLNVTDAALATHLQAMLADERHGVAPVAQGETIMLDYLGPNVAKAMHVGHLRPAVIGDAVKRIVKFAGYEALGDIHMGDWGLPIGQIISELALRHSDWVYFDAAYTGPYPVEPPFEYKLLEEIYPLASAACKESPERLQLARQATMELQNGRPGYRALWEHFTALSVADIKRNIAMLGVQFEIWKGEADVNALIPVLGEELKKRGLAVESEGAVVVPVAEESDNKEMPPLMFYKSDGSVTYGTTDLATLYERVRDFPRLKKLIYIVDKRQNLHFEQVFRATRRAGYAEGIDLVHIGFGTLNGPDGKPFKTRSGGLPRFDDLMTLAVEKAASRLHEADLAQGMPDTEQAGVAQKVAVAAIKFADLSNQAHVDYIFDLDRMISFEGKTGPYLLYQAVRIKSLLRKAEAQEDRPGQTFLIHDNDRALALLLTELPEVFDLALRNYTPHILCDYVYRLANAFSSFYGNCHILSEPDADLKASRLALCAMVLGHLILVLDLLGISVPERM